MMNSRPRMRPKRGRISSLNLVWIWYRLTGSCRYEVTVRRTMSVTTSSWVGPKQNSRSWRSLIRSSSGPYSYHRPDSCHSSAGWTAGMTSSAEPARSISSRMIASSLTSERQPSGR